jgi:hypothetical protein
MSRAKHVTLLNALINKEIYFDEGKKGIVFVRDAEWPAIERSENRMEGVLSWGGPRYTG